MAKGMDGYTGELLYDITKGETIPYSLTFTESDGVTPIDVTGWKVYIAFDTVLTCSDATLPLLEVELLPTDPTNGVISGDITDDETFSLTVSKRMYCSIRYIKSDGKTFIVDKGIIKVYACVNPRRVQ